MRKKRRSQNVVINSETRLFIQDSFDCCCMPFNYYSCITVDDIGQSRADDEKIWCPDPNKNNSFVVQDYIEGELSDGNTTFSTNYQYGNSTLKKFFDKNCFFDLQIHFGKCNSPNDFNSYDKVILLKNAKVTSYNISDLMAQQQSDQSVVTETADFSFQQIVEVNVPTFTLYEGQIVQDGPILDSTTICSRYCCLCDEAGSGLYYVQILECDDDCHRARVIYSTDNGCTYKVVNTLICEDILISQSLSSNILTDGTATHYLGVNPYSGNTIASVIRNSLYTLQLTTFNGKQPLRATNYYKDTYWVGTGGLIVQYDGTYSNIIADPSIPDTRTLRDISTIDGEEFVIGASDGYVYYGEFGCMVQTHLPVNTDAHRVAMVSDCSFVVATGTDGGYLHCNNDYHKMRGINGAITAFAFVDEYIGYAAAAHTDLIGIYQTVDGGWSWRLIDDQLSTEYFVTTISVCPENPSFVNVAGVKDSGYTTPQEQIEALLEWNYTGTGFTLIGDA